MDIAKIRKKLKEKESEASGKESQENGQVTHVQQDQTQKPEAAEKAPEPTPETPPEETVPVATEPEPQSKQASGESGQEEISKKEQTKTPHVAEKLKPEKTEEIIEILTFTLLKQEFAFKISQLEEILRYQRTTKVPNVPIYVLGLTSLRGKVIPVIDLKVKMSLIEKPSTDHYKGKVLIVKGPIGPIGVAVDRIIGVVRISKAKILPPPSHLSESELKFIYGIAIVDKRFVSIINMEEAISFHVT
jgi:purine-binding chemotaxis protein CheW